MFDPEDSLEPAGRRRPTCTPAEVWVPRRHHPKGYAVKSAGKVTVPVTPRG